MNGLGFTKKSKKMLQGSIILATSAMCFLCTQSKMVCAETSNSPAQERRGGGSLSLNFSTWAVVDLKNKSVKLMFENPSSSKRDIVASLFLNDELIMKSGKVTPGGKLIDADILETVNLSAGTYKGKLLLENYAAGTESKSMINFEIPYQITVR